MSRLGSTLSIEERVWRFEMALRFIDGKRSLGRGDERVGSRVPLLLQDLGCTVEDVRLVDRAWQALQNSSPAENDRAFFAYAVGRLWKKSTCLPDSVSSSNQATRSSATGSGPNSGA